jgi:hypothetical protein
MNRPRILRLLQIAFSVACGIVCLLLIVVWWRAYHYSDFAGWTFGGQRFTANSELGRLMLAWRVPSPGSPLQGFSSRPVDPQSPDTVLLKRAMREKENVLGIYIRRDSTPAGTVGTVGIGFPHGYLVVAVATLAAIPWITWRFSVRTLLIATMLVAAVLGLAVALR